MEPRHISLEEAATALKKKHKIPRLESALDEFVKIAKSYQEAYQNLDTLYYLTTEKMAHYDEETIKKADKIYADCYKIPTARFHEFRFPVKAAIEDNAPLDVIKYLIEVLGCPTGGKEYNIEGCGEQTWMATYSAYAHHQGRELYHLMQFLLEIGAEFEDPHNKDNSVWISALQRQDFEMVDWLIKNIDQYSVTELIRTIHKKNYNGNFVYPTSTFVLIFEHYVSICLDCPNTLGAILQQAEERFQSKERTTYYAEIQAIRYFELLEKIMLTSFDRKDIYNMLLQHYQSLNLNAAKIFLARGLINGKLRLEEEQCPIQDPNSTPFLQAFHLLQGCQGKEPLQLFNECHVALSPSDAMNPSMSTWTPDSLKNYQAYVEYKLSHHPSSEPNAEFTRKGNNNKRSLSSLFAGPRIPQRKDSPDPVVKRFGL